MGFKAAIIDVCLIISASVVAYIVFEKEFKNSYLFPCDLENHGKNECFSDYAPCPFCKY